MNEMKMNKSENDLYVNPKFCNVCGQEIDAVSVCLNCGTELEHKFCTKCGQRVQIISQAKIEQQDAHSIKETKTVTEKIASMGCLKLVIGVGVVVIIAILILNGIKTPVPNKDEIPEVMSSQSLEKQAPIVGDSFEDYLKEAIRVKGDELVNNS